jgi:predicted PurR-regulated permease PerM
LRAIGAIMETNRVSLIRAVLAILIIPGGIWLFGVFGGVIGMILHTAIATWLTRKLAESIRRDHHAPAPATRPLAT